MEIIVVAVSNLHALQKMTRSYSCLCTWKQLACDFTLLTEKHVVFIQPSFINIKLVWRGPGNIFSYSKMRNLGMKAERKKRNCKQGLFFFNINNSYKLSFSLKKLFVNLWHDQVCSHHLVAIHGSTYTVFSFYLYLLSQCIAKSGVTYMWEFTIKCFVGKVCSAVKSRFVKRPVKV